jgi:Uma2 family endonuclease
MIATIIDELQTIMPSPKAGEPPWPVALLFPRQGQWTEADYLELDTNRLIELSEGFLEVLPIPTSFHQLIAQLLCRLLEEFVLPRKLGLVFQAPFPVRLWPEKIREPDVLYLRPGRLTARDEPADGADLAIEVVSKGKRHRARDLITKRSEYARAGIGEYWIVDPKRRRITQLVLHGKKYREHGEFAPGSRVASVVLPGFEVNVGAVFAVEELLPPENGGSPRTKPTKRKPKKEE